MIVSKIQECNVANRWTSSYDIKRQDSSDYEIHIRTVE